MACEDINVTSPPRPLPRLVGGLLVGGASVRFGRPKALELLDGRSFAGRAARALRGVADEVVLLGEGPVPDELAGLERLSDIGGLRGPLAGVLAALAARADVAWLVAACDQPHLTVALLDWLVAHRAPERIAVLPRLSPGGIEPFPAVYEPGSRAVLERLAAGDGSIQPLATRDDVATPTPPAELAPALADVDAPGSPERG